MPGHRSEDDQARYFNAVLDRREGNIPEAERGLRDLIASEPRHPFVRYAARYELAQVLDRTERFDEAMVLLKEAKEMVLALADAKMLMRSYDQSAESIRRFTAAQPKNILDTWAKCFPVRKREAIPPLALPGRASPQRNDLAGTNSRRTPAWRRWTNRGVPGSPAAGVSQIQRAFQRAGQRLAPHLYPGFAGRLGRGGGGQDAD
jgi:tetratricopeptide (TPR) repeat protein